MKRVLTEFSPAALVRANRANLYEFFRHFENSPSMEFTKGDGLSRWSCALQYAWFNAFLVARDATPADGAYVDESLAYFKARNTSDITCWLEDGVNRSTWESLLMPRGFKLLDGPAGMSVDLDRLSEGCPLPAGAEIVTVRDEQGVRDYAHVIVHGFGFPQDWTGIAGDFLAGLGVDVPFRSYLAYWQGKPVSSGAVFFGEEVAGIYNVATVPEARGKGFGAAVTLAPLLEARRMGYRVGILQSSAMGLPVYKKMGFAQDSQVGSFYYAF